MKHIKLQILASLGAASFFLAMVGCDTTPSDVQSAKNEVREEQQETAKARAEGDQAVREAEAREKQLRETAMRQAKEDAAEKVDEAAQETQEARRERDENVAREQQQTAEAKARAERLAAELEAKQARDTFVTTAESDLEEIDARIELMTKELEGKEGTAREQLETKIEVLKVRREAVSDALNNLKNAEVLKWEQHKAAVESAIKIAKEDD